MNSIDKENRFVLMCYILCWSVTVATGQFLYSIPVALACAWIMTSEQYLHPYWDECDQEDI